MDFDASVKDVCTNLRNANCQNQFFEYTLCVDSLDLAFGYEHLKICWDDEWVIVAAIGRYDELKDYL